MAKRSTDSEFGNLRSVRREKQRRLARQDRLIKHLMLEESRQDSARKRTSNRQVKMDRVICHIQAIAGECAFYDEGEFKDFKELVRFLAIRGVMSWPRHRGSEPTAKEYSFISEALCVAQARKIISITQVDGKRRLVNHFSTLPCTANFAEDELFIFGRQARRQLQAA